jgi:uncharacterized glyoxalase superfamily protein PhnB
MNNYAKNCKSTVIPGLHYRNAMAMIEWLCETFGFQKQVLVTGPGDIVMHSQLTFGNGMIMIGSLNSGTPSSASAKHSDEIGGVESHMLSLIVTDCEELYLKAKAAGAKILSELEERDFGGRAFTCSDPEGHIWSFGTYDPWEAQQP